MAWPLEPPWDGTMARRCHPLLGLLAAAGWALSPAGPASASEDWRYGLARDEGGRQVFLFQPFRSGDPLEELERTFNASLDRSGRPHSWGICPRAPSSAVAELERRKAEQDNRQLGLQSRAVSWPEPRS